jgi:phage-related holin
MGDVVKNGICTMVGVIGSLIASQFGGWDAALSTLILFMAVDYITGLVVAGFSTPARRARRHTGIPRWWKGLCRKGETLLIVLVACRLDA